VATALGDAAGDISKLVSGDEVQDFTPGAISLKGRISSIAGATSCQLGLQERRHSSSAAISIQPQNVKIGTTVACFLEDVEGDTGLVTSPHTAPMPIASSQLEAIMRSKRKGDPVSGKVTMKIKGGLLVDIGVPVVFAGVAGGPSAAGQISDWFGRSIRCGHSPNRRGAAGNIGHFAPQDDAKQQREELHKRRTMDGLTIGEVRKGTVKKSADYRRVQSTWAATTACCTSST